MQGRDLVIVDLNLNLRMILRNGQALSRQNDCRNLANITREKTVVSAED